MLVNVICWTLLKSEAAMCCTATTRPVFVPALGGSFKLRRKGAILGQEIESTLRKIYSLLPRLHLITLDGNLGYKLRNVVSEWVSTGGRWLHMAHVGAVLHVLLTAHAHIHCRFLLEVVLRV